MADDTLWCIEPYIWEPHLFLVLGGLIAQYEKDGVERWELVLEVNKNSTCALVSAAKDVRILDRYYR